MPARQVGKTGDSQGCSRSHPTMSNNNTLWGAPRIHGELLKLEINVSQATVAKYMLRHPKPLSQAWRAFLKNHTKQLASIDFFTVPTISFRILYIFLILSHARRRIVHFNVTFHHIAEWTSHQLRHAFPALLQTSVVDYHRQSRNLLIFLDFAYFFCHQACMKIRGSISRCCPIPIAASTDNLAKATLFVIHSTPPGRADGVVNIARNVEEQFFL